MSPLTHPPLAVERPERRDSPAAPAGGLPGLLWLTWRQHRWTIVGSLVIAAVLTGWMAYLAARMTTLHHQCHDTICPPYSPQEATLSAPYGPVAVSGYLQVVVQYAPLLAGAFIGVPLLAREHEQRTLLLAWSQDVSPVRWLWTKLALLGAFVAALAIPVSVAGDHLVHVESTVTIGSMFDDPSFFVTGMLPVAVAVCWFTVGVAVGAAVRRVLPAAFAVVAGFVALTLGIKWRYPTLIPPLSFYQQLGQPGTGVLRNALRVEGGISYGPGRPSNVFDQSGHQLDFTTLHRLCPDPTEPDGMFACFARNHLQTPVVYQPASRIPVFHLILASGYLGLTAVALAVVWLIVRRTNLSAG